MPFGWRGADRSSRCKGRERGGECDEPVLWCVTPRGKSVPLEADGAVHFERCPDFGRFRP